MIDAPAPTPPPGPSTQAHGTIRILAVSSGGGHWDELMLLRGMLDKFDTVYVTTAADLAARDGVACAYVLADCNRNAPFRVLLCAAQAVRAVWRLKPDYVVSTGAAPGFFCILASRLVRARSIWIDSFANAAKLSMCGDLSRWCASLCLVQWQHLAGRRGVSYIGGLV